MAAYRTLNEGHVADPAITYIRHFSSNYSLEFDDRLTARGDGYWLLVNNRGLVAWGRCRDWYRRTDDGPWRFARRLVRGNAPLSRRTTLPPVRRRQIPAARRRETAPPAGYPTLAITSWSNHLTKFR